MPNNIIGNIRKNSGNINGGSADDESSDSDHEYFVYKNYFIGFLRIKTFIMQFVKNLIYIQLIIYSLFKILIFIHPNKCNYYFIYFNLEKK